ncbi:DUF1134 domain-containing protein [Faunimonas pinastri]
MDLKRLLPRIVIGIAMLITSAATGQAVAAARSNTFSPEEIVEAGHEMFGGFSESLAALVEKSVQQYGLPNGYIIGQEASGAFFGGARYGEGNLFTKRSGKRHVFWQGPSLGFDLGGDGNRTMMLVYNLPQPDWIFRRYTGVNGSAYLVGGLGMTLLTYRSPYKDPVYVVPIRSGVGARLGINIGYLKFTPSATWNPF